MSYPSSNLKQRLWPVGLLLIAMCAIQGGASLAHGLFPIAGPAGATSIRLIVASALLCVMFRPWRFRLPRTAWRTILVYGLALGAMNFLLYQAIARIPLGIAVALEFTGPLSVAVVSSRSRVDGFWVLLALTGLAVLLWPDDQTTESLDLAGMSCALGAGVCWALYIVFGQKAGQAHGIQSAVVGILVAAVLVAPIGVVTAGAELFTPRLLVLGTGVAVLSTALPYMLEMIAMPRLERASFGTLMSLEPAIGALSGLCFLGQSLSAMQWTAIGAIMAASIGTTLSPGRPAINNAPQPLD